jgi:hypothetical protein
MDRLQLTTTDASSNEAGVPTTEAVVVSGPTSAPLSLLSVRPASLHHNLSFAAAPLASGVPILALGSTSDAWLQLLQRAPAPSAQARLRAANIVDSAARPKVKETDRARKLRVVGSDRGSVRRRFEQ